MDAREITRQDLGTSAQVTGDAQMLFLQRYVSLRASHLNCFSAVSWKPPLKCFQEPGIELLPTTPSGPCNMPHLQLLTVEKSHLYSEIWCFHNCSFRQPTREMFGSSCSSKTTFFFLNYYFWQAKREAFNFCPRGKKCETWSQLGVPILPAVESLFLQSQLQPCSFPVSLVGFSFWVWALKKKKIVLFWFLCS